jgi:hypothetical protein
MKLIVKAIEQNIRESDEATRRAKFDKMWLLGKSYRVPWTKDDSEVYQTLFAEYEADRWQHGPKDQTLMAKQRKAWVYCPPKPLPPQMRDNLKAEVERKAEALVEEFLKPQFIKPPPNNLRWNCIIDIHSKWHRSFYYFIATYRSRGPTAIKPTFEAPFVRLEYIGNRRFNLAYMRHTGKWWEVYQSLTLGKCIKTIQENPIFQP